MKLQYEEMRITCQTGSHNLHSDMKDREPGAFHADCMKYDMHVWIKTFFKPWPALMWLTLKVVLLLCSASACEHSWSIEGWIHSNRRNRLGQKLVECLVRTHTNLKLEQRLELYEAGLLPWDIEMTVEHPVSDDDDGEWLETMVTFGISTEDGKRIIYSLGSLLPLLFSCFALR
jgi:hypothetical protein